MGQVNRIPNGFLDLLGVESLGRNPPAFADQIIPITDLTEFYAAQTLSAHTVDFNHTAFQNQQLVTVPSEETWFLRAVSVDGSLPGTANFERWQFSLDNMARNNTGAATSEPMIWVSDKLVVSIANQDIAGAFALPAPLALTAGTVLRAKLVERDTGPARTTALNWLFNRFNS